ncbi:MAG: AmmeMemoRadiSam system protein B [Candidatus Portnoybacteria bacterium CG_4_8_14_3_um_filter_44_10]|uniref:AmmeMemoRadiSam system protein B n=2 Tax=Candidatus Portnoyibacteriota TaxID=1817913 RepID=A0A2M7IFX9_9BACT|nr:MAG: AmmeMemoRadiSam system protein B [Candidatus Portnoybacteria bacterium CG_4_8_14_3_um_filter_44_10]PJA63409.1 MAG: AmmeMemoRadiSam system protein B [Candidatus Portnoybacteria bacterium CG_4_9_14_3_um_filter_44_9]
MLVFASICPHPPIIIPSVGGKELNKTRKTVGAMKKLAEYFCSAKPNTAIIISPHGPMQYDQMSITVSKELRGDFSQFGDFKTTLSFKNNLEVVSAIKEAALKNGIPVGSVDIPQLDHGSLVPLYYLTQDYHSAKVIPIAFSPLSLQTHFNFGQAIGEAIGKSDGKIAVVASGDLSHRVTPDAPVGYSPRGKEFDEKLIDLLKKNDSEKILNMDPSLIEEAGECGLRSIIILLGALSGLKYNFEILSYKAPFGVGYLVAKANLS